MARKEKFVRIEMPAKDEEGNLVEFRDRGKVFHIREMSARQTEEWATRCLLAMAHAGMRVPTMEDMKQALAQPSAAMAHRGFEALSSGEMTFRDVKPLLDEMMACISIVPDPDKTDYRRALVEDDVEETITLLFLRLEVFKLHMGFSKAAALSLLQA